MSIVLYTEDCPGSAMPALLDASLGERAPSIDWSCEAEMLFQTASMKDRAVRAVRTRSPDAVVVHLSSYPFVHESVAVRIRHRWPRLYSPAMRVMEAIRAVGGGRLDGSESPRGWLFRLPRAAAAGLIGADTDLSVEEGVRNISAALDELLRMEDLTVVCRLPAFYWHYSRSRSERAHAALGSLQKQLVDYLDRRRVPWFDLAAEVSASGERFVLASDGVHYDRPTRQFEVNILADLLLKSMLAD